MKSNRLKFTSYQVEALVIWDWFKLLSVCVFIYRNPHKYVSTRHCTWTVLCQLFPSLVYVFLGQGLEIWTQRFCCTRQSGLAWISIWMTYLFFFFFLILLHAWCEVLYLIDTEASLIMWFRFRSEVMLFYVC